VAKSEDLIELEKLLAEQTRRTTENRLAYYAPYPKQKEFHALSLKRERLLMAGNQQGKSLAGSMEVAAHLTGRYPEWWTGRRFDSPIRAWAAGVTGESTRDNPQRLLLGPLGAQGTGAIPKDAIKDVRMGRGLPDAVDTILVKHVSGKLSQLSFKSYEKGREKWQGETLDLIWLDEEPPLEIYSEALARITARSGMTFITFTPLLGMSDVVRRFLSESSPDRAHVQMSIADALHIPETERERIIAGYPEHEREARVNGVPMLGSGRVFPIAESAIVVDPFDLPHYWPRIVGLDFGWDHPTAAVWVAWDRDTDTAYLYDCYRQREATPVIHAAAIRSRGADIPVAWPHDGLAADKGSGQTLAELYKAQGVAMLRERATFPDGGNSTEAGVLEMLTRMQTARLKVFPHLAPWLEEFRTYHRKNGRLVDKDEDLMSATRYALMMLRYARVAGLKKRGGGNRAQFAVGAGDEPFATSSAPPRPSTHSNVETMRRDRERVYKVHRRDVADGVGE